MNLKGTHSKRKQTPKNQHTQQKQLEFRFEKKEWNIIANEHITISLPSCVVVVAVDDVFDMT